MTYIHYMGSDFISVDPLILYDLIISSPSFCRCAASAIFTMERLFSPCSRLHDIVDSQGLLEEVRRHHPEPFQELSLDVSTEELLNTALHCTALHCTALHAYRSSIQM
jgi:hypothetical protein